MEHFSDIPKKEYRPEIRWWLAEGMHIDETLMQDMRLLDDMGIGAIEFLAMEEPGADSAVYGWGSEEWVQDSHTLIKEATKRGMGVSMTSGTNWSNANLISITPDGRAASKELDFVSERLKPGEKRKGSIPACPICMAHVSRQELIGVVAARILEERQEITVLERNTLVLTELVSDNSLEWSAPEDGEYLLMFFWMHGTGQTAGPSCGVSYTINYLDRYGADAFQKYWEDAVLTPELREYLKKNGRGMLYMDSLELSVFGAGGQLWGYHFAEEFCRRRGYDVVPWLPFAVKDNSGMNLTHRYYYTMEDTDAEEKFHNDLYQTMTELYMENMLKPMQEWLHALGMQLRAEISYGLPFEISLPGKYVDGVETESLEFASQIESYRGLAGTAHIYRRLYSSETGATLMNYMMPLDFYNQIIFTQFAAGVSKTVFHGYSSICGSEASTYWPGHEGMFPMISERFGSRQPAFIHYQEWMAMIARYQMLLRKGKPRVDLGILRLDYHFNNMIAGMEKEETLYANGMMRFHKGMYWQDMELQDAGYTWDYFAPQILEEDFTGMENGLLYPQGPGYQALVIYQEFLPLKSAKKLLELARGGLRIVFVNGVTEWIRPTCVKTHRKAAMRTPFLMESDQELERIVQSIKALPNVRETDEASKVVEILETMEIFPRVRFSEKKETLLTCMRETKKETYVFVYHMMYAGKQEETATLWVSGGGRPFEADCWNGTCRELSGVSEKRRTGVTVTLQPGEATMLVLKKDLQPRQKQNRMRCIRQLDLPKWKLTVEDWDEGERKARAERRESGLVTTEVYFETKKTLLDAGEVELVPWKDMEKIGPEVSGIGTYVTEVWIPENWGEGMRAVLEIGSTNGSMADIYVNGSKAGVYNINRKKLEIGEWLKEGKNELKIVVASTLNNRLKARGYYERTVRDTAALLMAANNGNEEMEQLLNNLDGSGQSAAGKETDEKQQEAQKMAALLNVSAQVRDYGITGSVVLRIYQTDGRNESK